MNLWVLQYVIAVAEHGGVTQAAEELRVSQPALSTALQQLEREWASLVSEGRGASWSKGSSWSRCRPKAPRIACRNVLRNFMKSIQMFAAESPPERESWACWTSCVPQADFTPSIHFLNRIGFGF